MFDSVAVEGCKMQVLTMEQTRTPIILVVEDYADTRDMLKLLLESLNYAVLAAANGKDALSIAAKVDIDLIVTDFELPDITGPALIRRLHQMNEDIKRVPSVMLTALDADEYRHLAAQAGCNEFIVKPFNFDILDRVIGRLLREHGPTTRMPVLIEECPS